MAQQTPASSFDFGSVKIDATEELDGQSRSNRDPKANPFYAPLADSRANKNAGRKVTVPANVGAKTLYLIRQAADDQKIGARVVVKDSKGNTVTPVRRVKDKKTGAVTQKGTTMTDELKKLRGNVTVLFAAQDRKKSKKSREAAESNGTPETAAPAASESTPTPAPANA